MTFITFKERKRRSAGGWRRGRRTTEVNFKPRRLNPYSEIDHRARLIYVKCIPSLEKLANSVELQLESSWPGLLAVKWLEAGGDYAFQVIEQPSYMTNSEVHESRRNSERRWIDDIKTDHSFRSKFLLRLSANVGYHSRRLNAAAAQRQRDGLL